MEQPTKIIAIVSTKQDTIKAGGVPVFIAQDRESLQTLSSTLEKTLDAAAHEVNPSTMILVAH